MVNTLHLRVTLINITVIGFWIYTFNNECKDNDLYSFEWLASKTLATEPIVTPDPIPDKEKPTDQHNHLKLVIIQCY